MMISRIWKGQAAHETPKLKRNSNKADVGTISGEESLVSYPLWGETHLLHISNIMLFLSVDRSLSLSIIQFFSSTVVCRCSRKSSRLMWRWMTWTHGAHFQLCCVEWVGQWFRIGFSRLETTFFILVGAATCSFKCLSGQAQHFGSSKSTQQAEEQTVYED